MHSLNPLPKSWGGGSPEDKICNLWSTPNIKTVAFWPPLIFTCIKHQNWLQWNIFLTTNITHKDMGINYSFPRFLSNFLKCNCLKIESFCSFCSSNFYYTHLLFSRIGSTASSISSYQSLETKQRGWFYSTGTSRHHRKKLFSSVTGPALQHPFVAGVDGVSGPHHSYVLIPVL